jgi:hypothetical protein
MGNTNKICWSSCECNVHVHITYHGYFIVWYLWQVYSVSVVWYSTLVKDYVRLPRFNMWSLKWEIKHYTAQKKRDRLKNISDKQWNNASIWPANTLTAHLAWSSKIGSSPAALAAKQPINAALAWGRLSGQTRRYSIAYTDNLTL